MSVRLPNKAKFDVLLPALQALTRDWAERECTSFDEAVRRASDADTDDGSIWDMPAIDSKRCVSLLIDLEGLLGPGCRIPVSVIKAGGYASVDDLIGKLLPKIREKCLDVAKPGLASAGIPAAPSRPSSRVLP
ncbi:hypothetical protein WME75_04410 [Sorangium sp. So ce1014]|uniref:hypothetical protein n=1 Tax=Sorangium sp. So ce1014 TaxID=3133326 RepID=UPI003F634929